MQSLHQISVTTRISHLFDKGLNILYSIPFALQAFMIAIGLGFIVAIVIFSIQQENLAPVLSKHLFDVLEQRAEDSIKFFNQEIDQYVYQTAQLAQNYHLVTELKQKQSLWSKEYNQPKQYDVAQQPLWLKYIDKQQFQPYYVLLFDQLHDLKEVYHLLGPAIPDTLLKVDIGYINPKFHLAMIADMPHILLLTPVFVEKQTLAYLMLVLPLNSDFSGFTEQPKAQGVISVIFNGNIQAIVASSNIDKVPVGSRLGQLKSDYVMMQQQLPKLGAANLSLQFLVLMPKQESNEFYSYLLQLAQKWHSLAAISHLIILTSILLFISFFLSRLLQRIELFSKDSLKHPCPTFPSKNQLILLDKRIQWLMDAVMASKKALEIQHQKQLNESNALKTLVLDAVLDCIITIDQQGYIIEFNHAAEQTFGCVADEVKGQLVVNVVIPPRLREQYQRKLMRYLKHPYSKSARDLEIQAWHSDGSELLMELAIRPITLGKRRLFTAFLHNITRLKQREKEFRSLAKFPQESPSPMLRITNKGVLLFANRTSRELLDYWGCNIGQTLPLYWKQLIETVYYSNQSKEKEVSCQQHYFSLLFAPMTDQQYINVYGRDITAIREAEEIAHQHQNELVHVCRLSTMGEVATGLAHELNQPLTAIVNYAKGSIRRIQQNGNSQADSLLEAMDQVSTQAERAGEIIKRLRNLVRKRGFLKAETDLNAIVMDTINFIDFEIKKYQVKVVLKLSKQLLKVSVDTVQIEQVLLNLIRNALEAIDEFNPPIRRIYIETKRDNQYALLKLRDTGPGMAQNVLDLLFHPFFTTKSDGMGMGLAISQSIIQDHQGHLSAKSDLGKGTTFFMNLPLIKRQEKYSR